MTIPIYFIQSKTIHSPFWIRIQKGLKPYEGYASHINKFDFAADNVIIVQIEQDIYVGTDFNLAKLKIPPGIKKAFDRGQIAKIYREIYKAAAEISTLEAERFRLRKLAEGMVSLREALRNGEEPVIPSVSEIKQQTTDYKNERLDFHMKEMVRLLESHAKRKLVKRK